MQALREGLRQLDYIEGQNITIELESGEDRLNDTVFSQLLDPSEVR